MSQRIWYKCGPYHLMKLQRNPRTDKDTNAAIEKTGYIKNDSSSFWTSYENLKICWVLTGSFGSC